MSVTVKMFAPAGLGGSIQTANSGTVFVQSDGTVSINAADVPDFLKMGYQFAVQGHEGIALQAPVAASAAVTVTSVALANGTLTIAAQPDVPRQLQAVVFPGTTSIVAGALAMTYVANDGTTHVDSLALACANQAAGVAGLTVTTTLGVEHLTSAVVTGLSGGTSPGVEVGTNAFVAVPVPPRFQDFVVTAEKKVTPTTGSLGLQVPADEATTSVIASGALVSPGTAPDGTHGFQIYYNYTSPG